ncbi:hypothetical protein A6U87_04535 [Rhizobium sp. AC44/96]|uniref:hypothetical protein n=1 Tax=Rhizobium sp. AC44/96 TaxID=1841654 RepID=UPI00080FB7D9|nr:hypothetical protein [Rhizobium sp. AC44/96]OCJ18172.1 hypothetical protein A6U87_04535 [Rhizobium sp. AC44/96]
MSRVSSVADTSYAYLATLSRLDTNGDGMLSRSERAADEKPGILKQLSESDVSQEVSPKLSNGVLSFMMGSRSVGSVDFFSQDTDDTTNSVYQNTYGQYDLDIAS